MTLRHPIIAARTHFDPRAKAKPWTAYSSEASRALQEEITERGPGNGFFECLNFAFDHPDNVPELHIYLPPPCLPSRETTDTSNLLIFIFTYKEADETSYPAHLVAVVGHATLVVDAEQYKDRKRAGKKYGEQLQWCLSADRDLACVLVEPLEMVKLPVPSLLKPAWKEGRRYLAPAEAKAVLELARKNGIKHADEQGEIAKAARRQVQVLDRILEEYECLREAGPPPVSTAQKLKQGKSSKGKGGPLVADDVAGRRAEEFVYRLELKRVGNLVKKHNWETTANRLVAVASPVQTEKGLSLDGELRAM